MLYKQQWQYSTAHRTINVNTLIRMLSKRSQFTLKMPSANHGNNFYQFYTSSPWIKPGSSRTQRLYQLSFPGLIAVKGQHINSLPWLLAMLKHTSLLTWLVLIFWLHAKVSLQKILVWKQTQHEILKLNFIFVEVIRKLSRFWTPRT